MAGSRCTEFPLLSELPVCPSTPWPEDPVVDNLILNKTSEQNSREKLKKNPADIMKDSETILKCYLQQSKYQRAIHDELKGLLEHEKKILEQLIERSTKFSELKEENKKRQDEWENDHKIKLPVYNQYLSQLMELPEAHGLAQDGVPGEVEQRVLYNIVDSTGNVTNNAIVQLSVQNTLVNDVDLSLSKLKQFCNLMLKYVDNWLKSLSTQSDNAKKVRDQWGTLHNKIENLKSEPAVDGAAAQAGITSADFQKEMAKIVDRISKIETNQDLMRDQCCQDKEVLSYGENREDSFNNCLRPHSQNYPNSLEPTQKSQNFYDSLQQTLTPNNFYDSLEPVPDPKCTPVSQRQQTFPNTRYTLPSYPYCFPDQNNLANISNTSISYEDFKPKDYSSPTDGFPESKCYPNRTRYQ